MRGGDAPGHKTSMSGIGAAFALLECPTCAVVTPHLTTSEIAVAWPWLPDYFRGARDRSLSHRRL